MTFFENIHETSLTRFSVSAFDAFAHRPVAKPACPVLHRQRAIARAAVREVLG